MTKPLGQLRSYEHIVGYVLNSPWCLLEDRVQAMCDVLELRVAGQQFDDDELQQRLNRHQSRSLGEISALFDMDESDGMKPLVRDGVAVIPVHGVLSPRFSMFQRISGGTSTQIVQAQLREAAADDKVHAILLDIDSPGGDAHGNQEVANLLREIRTQKTVKAVFSNLGASAAYYVGSSAGEVIASPSAEIGSIGVYMVQREISQAADKAGVKFHVFRIGENKNPISGVEPVTDAAKGQVIERMTALYDQFVGSVAEGRGVSVETVLANFGRGKLYLADKAVEQGLVDDIGTLSDVFHELRRAGSSAASARSGISAAATTSEGVVMDPLVKQAAIAAGLPVDDASTDEAINAAIDCYFMGKGTTRPEDNKALATQLLAVGQTVELEEISLTSTLEPFVANVVDTDGILQAERQRVTDIQAAGEMFGTSQDVINAEIEAGTSYPDALKKLNASAAETHRPVGVRVSQSSEDKFAELAVQGIFETTAQREFDNYDAKDIPAGATQIANLGGMGLVRQCLQHTGQGARMDGLVDDLTMAGIALAGDGADLWPGMSGMDGQIFAAGGATMNPASLPNVAASVVDKLIREAMQQVDVTYREWAVEDEPVSNFDPKEMIDTGHLNEFEQVDDNQIPKEDTFDEEPNWIQPDEYKKRLLLTPRMIIQGQLGRFFRAVRLASDAHERTVNRQCVQTLLNGTTGDGYKLIDDTNHKNQVTSGNGGTPGTQAQYEKMRDKLRQQTDVSGNVKLGLPLRSILVPQALESVTEKYLDPDLRVRPSSDANGNTFRGKIDYHVEYTLDEFSTAKWYGFTNTSRAAAVVFAFMRGYQRMRRRFHVDPNTQSRILDFHSIFGTAAVNYRGVVENVGS